MLIILEGPDAVGKSTLASALARRLDERGKRIAILSFSEREPNTLGAHICAVHDNPHRFDIAGMTAASKQLLFVAAKIDVIEAKIRKLLHEGTTIILDRYWWSTWVCGRMAGIPETLLDTIVNVEREVWADTQPTLVVLMKQPKPVDRIVELPCWTALANYYRDLAMREPFASSVLLLGDSPHPDTACDLIENALAPWSNDGANQPQQESLIDVLENGLPVAAPLVLTHLSPIKATAAYDTYWRFAAERQEIFFRRIERRPIPWTNDVILQTFKFTNAYRASDRVSQFLIKNVIYGEHYSGHRDEVFFRILLFKLFNKISTWQLLERSLGLILHSEYSFERYDDVLTKAMARGERIYSGAYIMPSGGRILGSNVKHRNHLRLLEKMMADEAPRKIQDAKTMHGGFDVLLSFPMIGEFLAYQYIIDINYSELTDFSERDFVIPGPGALDGIRKCFVDLGGLNEPELIRFIADQQEKEFARLELSFRSLWGRPLQLIDCQNVFCEVDKYSRVFHPEIAGISGRTRIKQKFSQNPDAIDYWYPPKWGLNDLIADDSKDQSLSKGAL